MQAEEQRDLVVIALSGVQRFIRESRSTSDLSAASEIVARLAMEAADVCHSVGADVVFPVASGGRVGAGSARADGDPVVGVPNRVVALAALGAGEQLAHRVAEVVTEQWAMWVRQALGRDGLTPG